MVSSMLVTCVALAAALALEGGVHGYGNGAAHTACIPMRVAHGVPQAGPSPYYISLPDSPITYTARRQVRRKYTCIVNISQNNRHGIFYLSISIFIFSADASNCWIE